MNDVDVILRDLGMETPPPPEESQSDTPQETEESSQYTEEDLTEILQDNGYVEQEEYTELPEEETDESEDSDRETQEEESLREDNEAINNRLEEAREALEEAIEEATGVPASAMESTEETPFLNLDNLPEEIDEEVLTPPESAKIPLNSPTLLIDESTSRFSGTEWYNEIQKARIIVGGCGGISSNLCFQLARMVPASIFVYDDDTVERVNMAGQLFSYSDIGKSKVSAMADMISNYTSMRQVSAIQSKFTSNTEPGDIMMCGFDNMSARKIFFYSWLKHVESKPMEERGKCLLLDGRLSIDTLQILCIKGDDTYNINRYQDEFLFNDSQADATVCSMKQTTYLACMIGSLMTNLFTNFVANSLNPIIPYDLPFFIEYDAQNMIFKTES